MASFQQVMCPLGELIRRIKRDIGPGQALYGVKFDEKFDDRNDKADSLPKIRVVDYSMAERHAGTSEDISTPYNLSGINSALRQTQEVVFQLVCDERNGWLTDETVTNIRKMGAINIANMIIDCLEMDDDSRPDLSLGGVADAPVMFQIRESGVLQLGIVIDITASITSLLYQRTRRSSILLKV